MTLGDMQDKDRRLIFLYQLREMITAQIEKEQSSYPSAKDQQAMGSDKLRGDA